MSLTVMSTRKGINLPPNTLNRVKLKVLCIGHRQRVERKVERRSTNHPLDRTSANVSQIHIL